MSEAAPIDPSNGEPTSGSTPENEVLDILSVLAVDWPEPDNEDVLTVDNSTTDPTNPDKLPTVDPSAVNSADVNHVLTSKATRMSKTLELAKYTFSLFGAQTNPPEMPDEDELKDLFSEASFFIINKNQQIKAKNGSLDMEIILESLDEAIDQLDVESVSPLALAERVKEVASPLSGETPINVMMVKLWLVDHPVWKDQFAQELPSAFTAARQQFTQQTNQPGKR